MKKFIALVLAMVSLTTLVACLQTIDFNKLYDKIEINYGENQTKDTLTKDFTLPEKVEDHILTWSSSHTNILEIIDYNAKITQPQEQTTITLTAKFTEDTNAGIEFKVIVLAKTAILPNDKIPNTTNTIFLKGYELTWEKSDEIQTYAIYLDGEKVGETKETLFDLSGWKSQFNKTVELIISDIETTDEPYLMDYISFLNPTYIGFDETEGFEPTTTYNNSTPNKIGKAPHQWLVLHGTASTTSKITGTLSLQMRTYKSNNITPYVETDFALANLKEITFKANSEKNPIKVEYSFDKINYNGAETFNLTSSTKTYTYQVNQTTPVYIRITVLKEHADATYKTIIDDMTFQYSEENQLTFVAGSLDLNEIKKRNEARRNAVKPIEGQNAYDDTTYYAALNGLTGEDFKEVLRNILNSTINRVDYDSVQYVLEKSDLVKIGEDKDNYLHGIYDNHQIKIIYWNGGNAWNKEHVWPNSRLGIPRVSGSDKNIGTDLHNLRASLPSTNNDRSNRYFDELSAGGFSYYPGDDHKGDVARILFYMVAAYKELTLNDMPYPQSGGGNNTPAGAQMAMLNKLLQWHLEDPVDDFEINRNNIIYQYQGNRNPFIDKPEYVGIYFKDYLDQNKEVGNLYVSLPLNSFILVDKTPYNYRFFA